MLLRFFIPSAYGCALSLAILTVCAGTTDALSASLPDGSVVSPVGFTTPVESFASAEALSPDRGLLAVLSSDAGALDILSLANKGGLIERLRVPGATSLAWTSDGLYVARGYAGRHRALCLRSGQTVVCVARRVTRRRFWITQWNIGRSQAASHRSRT